MNLFKKILFLSTVSFTLLSQQISNGPDFGTPYDDKEHDKKKPKPIPEAENIIVPILIGMFLARNYFLKKRKLGK